MFGFRIYSLELDEYSHVEAVICVYEYSEIQRTDDIENNASMNKFHIEAIFIAFISLEIHPPHIPISIPGQYGDTIKGLKIGKKNKKTTTTTTKKPGLLKCEAFHR